MKQTTIGVTPAQKKVVESAKQSLEAELGVSITQGQAVALACKRVQKEESE